MKFKDIHAKKVKSAIYFSIVVLGGLIAITIIVKADMEIARLDAQTAAAENASTN